MSRLKIEKYIVAKLKSQLQAVGFTLSEETYRQEHYARFTKTVNGSTYTWTIFFLKYGNIEFSVSVSYQKFDQVYNLFFDEDVNDFGVFRINLRRLKNPKNSGGVFNSGDQVDFPFGKQILEGNDLDKICDYIYSNYFQECIPKIIKETDSIEKADKLINGIVQYNENGRPLFHIYCPSFPDQLLCGFIIAIILRRKDLRDLEKSYKAYLDSIDEGQDDVFDQFRKATTFVVTNEPS